jgi:large subunit ribosomal protein L25
MVRDVQYDAVTDEILHVDLMGLQEGRPVEVEVPIRGKGTPEAVKSGIGVLVRDNDYVKIKAVPEKIPNFIEVDVSSLETMGDTILFKELEVPEGVEIVEKSKEFKVAFVIARAQKVIEVEDIKEEETLEGIVDEEGELGALVEEGEEGMEEVIGEEEGEVVDETELTE